MSILDTFYIYMNDSVKTVSRWIASIQWC